ncbi:MAG TPA: D-alanyl-D-alanine carboxypeptidase family protein [Chondromyces sp.]|nr:D-alanyl-D-alanine carboxypeptidase family protein [Chondromyces sp.]
MKWLKYILLIVILCTTLTYPPRSFAASNDLDIQARAAILVDASSGRILYGEHINDSLPVASMSKMMTQYLVLEHIKKGSISWDTVYTAKAIDQRLSTKPGLSNIPLYEGEKYTVKELYHAMMIVSANAASRALGEMIGQTDEKFIYMMNEKAKELHLTHSYFVNTSGLNNQDIVPDIAKGTNPTDENHMSARDLALLTYHIHHDFPDRPPVEQIEKETFYVTDTLALEMHNSDQMLPNGKYPYDGIIGMKTGMSQAAGHGFTALAKRDDREFISVIIDGRNNKNKGTSSARFVESKKLLDYGFENWHYLTLSPVDLLPKAQRSVMVHNGKKDQTLLAAKKQKILIEKNGQFKPKAELTMDITKLNNDNELVAPLKKGASVGTIQLAGESFHYLTPELKKAAVKPVHIHEDIEKENWFILFFKNIF